MVYNLEDPFTLKFNIVFKALFTGDASSCKGKSLHSICIRILKIIEWYSKKFVLTLYLMVNSIIVNGTFIVPRKSAMVEIPLFSHSLLIWIEKVGFSQIGVNLMNFLSSGASDCQNVVGF